MKLSRPQILSLSAIALQHDVEASFEFVDTDNKGGHGLLVITKYTDENFKEHELRDVYRLPVRGGSTKAERKAEPAEAL